MLAPHDALTEVVVDDQSVFVYASLSFLVDEFHVF